MSAQPKTNIPDFVDLRDLTYGQISKVENYFTWANQNGVFNECATLYLIANTSQNPEGLINFLKFIFDNTGDLERWSECNQAATELYKISLALQANPNILLEDSLPIEKPAKLLLHGYLETSYLLALVLTTPTHTTFLFKSNFNGLRLWLLVEAYKRGLGFNFLDKFIADVCTQLRLTKDGSGDVFKCVSSLYKNHNDYDAVTVLINMQANLLLKKGLASSADKFLKTLIKVTKGDQSPFDIKDAKPSLNLDYSKPRLADVNTQQEDLNPNAEDLPSRDLGGKEDEALTEVEVDLSEPFHLRKLSSNSIFLSSVEQSQFLRWSWHSLNKFELTVFNNEVDKLLNSKDSDKNFAGSILWIGFNLGRSPHRVLDFLISEDVYAEWSFNPNKKCMHRLPPRRKASWSPSVSDESWIKPSAQINFFNLPEQVLHPILKRTAHNNSCERIVDLWFATNNSNPIEYIKNQIVEALPRFTPGILNQVLAYQLFYKSQDYRFTKTVTSLPNSGLPPSCAYASWSSSNLLATQYALPKNEIDNKNISNEIILFGSALNPLETNLIEQIKLAGKKLEKIRNEGNLLLFHNAFSIYLHLMLLAATGARPINNVFESITHFDFNEHFVFIDDKSDVIGNKGRLVPIPEALSTYLNVEYKSHLRLLADKLNQKNPEISAEILNILAGKRSEKIPFLFLLSTDDLCGWKSITQTEIRQSKLLETPLPLNLFRHRLAKFLTEKNIDVEIIDGLLGHIEYGSETYGKYSERIWLQDAKELSVSINYAFESLTFLYVKHQPTLVLKSNIHRGLNQEKIYYGYSARALQRSSQLKATIKVARAEIHTFLNGRLFNQLSDDEINELSTKMVFSALGTPRQDAFLRHRVLERQIARFVNKTGKDIKLKKRYLSPAPESPYTADAANSILKVKKLRHVLAKHIINLNLYRLASKECLFYAKLLLIFENKVTDKYKHYQVLEAKSFRLSQMKGCYYLEILADDSDPESPVQRMKISQRLTILLSKLKNSPDKTKTAIADQYPKDIVELLNSIQIVLEATHNRGYVTILETVSELINQHNFISMPGVVAGYLSGQVESWSLSLFDFVKLHTGFHVKLPWFGDGSPNEVAKDESNHLLQVMANDDKDFSPNDAKAFLQEIRNLLNAYHSKKIDSKREFLNQIDNKIESFSHKVSSTLLILGQWVKYLTEANKRNKKEKYEISSVLRYFNALSDKFEKFALQNNIFAMDEDELTELYSQLLLDANKSSRYYVAHRLFDFHRWASRKFELEEPDWSELPEVVKSVNVCSGFISETEYQKVLKILLVSHPDKAYARSMAFFTFLVYRFGLRSNEALGLLKRDLTHQNVLVLLIQNNHIRKLKNKHSRRQVPLLFNISKTEEKIIEQHLAFQISTFANEPDSPLFFEQRRHLNLSEIQSFKSNILKVIKHVTGNQMSNIHHARHAAANHVAYKLHDPKLAGWDKLNSNIHLDLKMDLLGGDFKTTRRSGWASSRFLGHAGRATQYKSYIHFLGDWADAYFEPFEANLKEVALENVLDLDNLPTIDKVNFNNDDVQKPRFIIPTTNLCFRALVLMSNGKSIDTVSAITFLARDTVSLIYECAVQVSKKLRALDGAGNSELSLMSKISKSGFERIFDFTVKLDRKITDTYFASLRKNQCSLAELISLVGMDGQLLMYRDYHFHVIKSLLDFCEIKNNLYAVYKSNKAENDFHEIEKKYEMNIKKLSDNINGKKIQLDTVKDHDTGFHVDARCGLIFFKNSASTIRNRYELLIAYIIFVVLIDNT